MKIQIEDNVPIPDIAGGKPRGELRNAVEALKVGQSFEIPRTMMQPHNLYKLARIVGIKIATRQVNCESRRIWRVK